VNTVPTLDVLASWIIGDGTGTGIDLMSANARIRSSYVTHHGTGISIVRSTSGSSTATITNNTIVHHGTGVSLYRYGSGYNLSVTLENNVIAASTGTAVVDQYLGSYPTALSPAGHRSLRRLHGRAHLRRRGESACRQGLGHDGGDFLVGKLYRQVADDDLLLGQLLVG
jgi:hypothetical protein